MAGMGQEGAFPRPLGSRAGSTLPADQPHAAPCLEKQKPDVLHPHGQHTRCSRFRAVLQKELNGSRLQRQGVLRVGDAMASFDPSAQCSAAAAGFWEGAAGDKLLSEDDAGHTQLSSEQSLEFSLQRYCGDGSQLLHSS